MQCLFNVVLQNAHEAGLMETYFLSGQTFMQIVNTDKIF